jgi:hypothetical protein
LPVLLVATTPDIALWYQDLLSGDFPEFTSMHRQLVDETAIIIPIERLPGI